MRQACWLHSGPTSMRTWAAKAAPKWTVSTSETFPVWDLYISIHITFIGCSLCSSGSLLQLMLAPEESQAHSAKPLTPPSTAGILQYFMLLLDGKVLQMAHVFLGNGHVSCLISQMSSKRCHVAVSDLVWKSPYSIINLLSLLLPHCIVLVLIFNIIFMHF